MATMADKFEEIAKLFDEGKWTVRANARNMLHAPVEPNDPSACYWCMLGAMTKVDPKDETGIQTHGVSLVAEAYGFGSNVPYVNDRLIRDAQDAAAWARRAAALAKRRGL